MALQPAENQQVSLHRLAATASSCFHEWQEKT
jgi:hypothetical protein